MHGKTCAGVIADNLADDESKDIVLFINDYFPEYGSAFKKLSKRLNRELHGVLLIDSSAKRDGRAYPDKEHLFEEVVCDFNDAGKLRATIKRFEDRLLLVSSSGEHSQLDFGRVLPHVPYLLGPTERSLEWATHKGKMREVIGAYNPALVPNVRQVTGPVESEIKEILLNMTFPMVIKPTGLSDSCLVSKVTNERELRSRLHYSFALIHDAYRRDGGNGEPAIIVEEFIHGDMYSVDGYVDQTGNVHMLPLLRSTPAHELGHDGFYIYRVETNHGLTESEHRAGQRAAEEAIHAIGLRSSLAHVELFNTAEGWKIIELGARPGNARQEIYQVAYGVDHSLNELLLKIGQPPEIRDTLLTHALIMNVAAEEEGTVATLSDAKEVERHPAVYMFCFKVDTGDTVKLSSNGGMTIAAGVIVHKDAEQARKISEELRRKVVVTVHESATTKPLPAHR